MKALQLSAISILLSLSTQAQDMAVHGELVHTMVGSPLRDAVVLIQDGKITAIGPRAEVQIPAGVPVQRAQVVTPGLIDAHSVVGLAGWLNIPHDSDESDPTDPIQPELRALDAYNPREPLVGYLRDLGVTTLHTGHAPTAVISGQTMIVKTAGNSVEEATMVPFAMVAANLGEESLREGKAPGTRSKSVALLRQQLVNARAYATQRAAGGDKAPDRDLRLEALAQVLAREVPLMITANRANDLATAIRLADEFGFRLVLDGAAEIMDIKDQIIKKKIPVILHATMQRATGERESLSFETAGKLAAAGIPFALQSGYEAYVPKTRVVLFEAAQATTYGLPYERALASITIDAARLLGIDARVGSLAVGKDADLALYDGDPFEYTSHCIGTIIDGKEVSSGSH